MTPDALIMTLARIEAQHLSDLVAQFAELLIDDDRSSDPAVSRLVPDAYPDDTEAAREFRAATERDLLDRREADAQRVLGDLAAAGALEQATDSADDVIDVSLDPEASRAWLRTLAAIRLVVATRLGIVDEDDHPDDDPRFGVYDWLGYRLEGLVQALSQD